MRSLPQFFSSAVVVMSVMTLIVALIHNGSDMQHFLSGMTAATYLCALAAWIDGGIDLGQLAQVVGE